MNRFRYEVFIRDKEGKVQLYRDEDGKPCAGERATSANEASIAARAVKAALPANFRGWVEATMVTR